MFAWTNNRGAGLFWAAARIDGRTHPRRSMRRYVWICSHDPLLQPNLAIRNRRSQCPHLCRPARNPPTSTTPAISPWPVDRMRAPRAEEPGSVCDRPWASVFNSGLVVEAQPKSTGNPLVVAPHTCLTYRLTPHPAPHTCLTHRLTPPHTPCAPQAHAGAD